MHSVKIRIAVLVAGVAWVGLAAAQDAAPERAPASRPLRAEPPPARVDHFMQFLDNPRISKELNLTEAQKAQIKDAMFGHQKKMIGIRAELETTGMEQAKLLSEDPTDLDALMSAVEKAGKVRTEMAKLQMRHLVEVRAILTPEQRSKLHEITRKLRERRSEEGANRRQLFGDGHRSGEKRGLHEGRRPASERAPETDEPASPPPSEGVDGKR